MGAIEYYISKTRQHVPEGMYIPPDIRHLKTGQDINNTSCTVCAKDWVEETLEKPRQVKNNVLPCGKRQHHMSTVNLRILALGLY